MNYKQFFYALLTIVLPIAASSQTYIYYSTSTSFNSGTYYVSGWGGGTTVLTIPTGQAVTFVFNGSAYGGGPLVVNGSLVTQGGNLQAGSTLSVGSGASMSVSGSLTTSGAATIGPNATLTSSDGLQTNSTFSILSGSVVNVTSGNVVLNSGNLTINANGTLNVPNITFNGANAISGSLNVSNNMTIHGGTTTLVCPGQIVTQGLTNNNSNTIAGKGYVQVNGTFTSNNPLTNSANIVLNASGAGPTVSGKNSGAATLGTASPCSGLPVNFGKISALIRNNVLIVNWETHTEIDNRYFEILASEDGNRFTTISEKINSKSLNGNSSTVISYSFSMPVHTIPWVMSVSFISLLLLSGFVLKRRIQFLLFICLSVFTFSCTKDQDDKRAERNSNFIRIKQVSLNEEYQYSPVVKVYKSE